MTKIYDLLGLLTARQIKQIRNSGAYYIGMNMVMNDFGAGIELHELDEYEDMDSIIETEQLIGLL